MFNVAKWASIERQIREAEVVGSDGSRAFTAVYTNWKGETRVRSLEVLRIWWGRTKWHPTEGWLVTAIDLESGEQRDFSWEGFNLKGDA